GPHVSAVPRRLTKPTTIGFMVPSALWCPPPLWRCGCCTLGLGWLARCWRLYPWWELWVRPGERDGRCTAGTGRREGVGRDREVQLPVGEIQLVAQARWIVAVHRAHSPGQLVLGTDPDLDKRDVAHIGHHVCGRIPDHVRLADGEGVCQPSGDGPVGVGD